MLVEHRIDDVDERLVAIEEAVPPGEQVSLEPAFALMFAQHRVDHAAAGGQALVSRADRRIPLARGRFEQRTEAVRDGLVRPEHAEVAQILVQRHDLAQERAERARVAGAHHAVRGHVDGEVAKVRHAQIAQQQSAVGMRIRAHAARAAR